MLKFLTEQVVASVSQLFSPLHTIIQRLKKGKRTSNKCTSVKGDVQDGHTLQTQPQVSSVSVLDSERHFSRTDVTEPLGESKAGVCQLPRASKTVTTHVRPW